MTDREKAIVTAYTGVLMLDWSKFHEWVEDFMGQPVYTHDFAVGPLTDNLKRKVQPYFFELCGSEEEDSNTLEDVEPADVAPVVHAHWIINPKYSIVCNCSNCGVAVRGGLGENYCFNCGAKMDEEVE